MTQEPGDKFIKTGKFTKPDDNVLLQLIEPRTGKVLCERIVSESLLERAVITVGDDAGSGHVQEIRCGEDMVQTTTVGKG